MSTWDTIDEKYYSGQGAVLLAERDALGNPKGFEYVGNVSALKLAIATSVLEHKESHTGQRGTDKRITTETKCTLSMTMENYLAANLARALRGTSTTVASATNTDTAIKVYPGKVSSVPHVNISTITVKQGAANTLTLYTNDSTPWDYQVNADAGSFFFNDGSVLAQGNLGIVPTAIAVGATTTLTVPTGHGAVAGDSVVTRGLTGADAADMNGIAFTVASVTATTIVLTFNSTGKTITTAAGTRSVYLGMPGTVTYNNAAQKRVDSLDAGAKELFMRFEGLNTADENASVVVEVFKFSTDPLKELDLISDGIQQFVMEGSVLADSLRPSGSNYFRVLKAD